MTIESVTLLEFTPNVDGDIVGGKPQRCTRGHEWDFGFRFAGVALDSANLFGTIGREEFCFFCLRDLLREKCGRVKDV